MEPSDRGPDMSMDAVVFDLGGVLIEWDPRRLYRGMFDGDDDAMEAFLRDVCSPRWIGRIDAGQPFAEAVRELSAAHPEHRAEIEAFRTRWSEMLGDSVAGTVRVLERLHRSDTRLYALSNWSVETFPIAEQRFSFLRLFDGILISGDAGSAKPALGIFATFLDRFGLEAEQCLFIDDNATNVAVATGLGFEVIRFESPEQLETEMRRRRLLQ